MGERRKTKFAADLDKFVGIEAFRSRHRFRANYLFPCDRQMEISCIEYSPVGLPYPSASFLAAIGHSRS